MNWIIKCLFINNPVHYRCGLLIARSALYVGDRFRTHSLSLSVCLCQIFVIFAFGRSGGFTLLLTGVLTQGSCFCCFGQEMNQFEIELPVNSSGLGVPKTVVFS